MLYLAVVQASELPWKEPSKGLLDLGRLGETIDDLAEDFKVSSPASFVFIIVVLKQG